MWVGDGGALLQFLEHRLIFRFGSVYDFSEEVLTVGVPAGEVGEAFLLVAGVDGKLPLQLLLLTQVLGFALAHMITNDY